MVLSYVDMNITVAQSALQRIVLSMGNVICQYLLSCVSRRRSLLFSSSGLFAEMAFDLNFLFPTFCGSQ